MPALAPSYRILVVDDDHSLRGAIAAYLRNRDYEIVEADTCRSAIEALTRTRPDAAILDFSLPDGNSLPVLEQLRALDPLAAIIILTAHGSIELAVEAVKKGADNFLTKPSDLTTLAVVLERALESQRAKRKQVAKSAKQERAVVNPFLGTSAAIRKLEDQVRKIVNADSPLLLQGETGTGKTILARWIHANSPRRDEALVDLNCATFSRELLEAELFGFEKGSFTGAFTTKQGLFEVAHRGTVFLDEIGDIDPQIQPKLLKILEDKQLRRIGDLKDRAIDVRLVAATHQNLPSLVRENKFRSDLYFRISTIPLTLPALRDRTEDIPTLATMFVTQFAKELGRGTVILDPDALEPLVRYPWPGNIRELRNVLERAVLLSEGGSLRARDLQFEMHGRKANETFSTSMTLREMEKAFIDAVLREENGHVAQTADRLDVPKSSLYQKLKEFGITPQKDLASKS